MKLKNKNISKMSILFYCIGAILMIGFILTAYNVTIYIMDVIAQGGATLSSVSDWVNIMLYYVNNTFVFLGLSVLILGCGYGIQLLKNLSSKLIQEDVVEDKQIEKVVDETIQDVVEA